MNCELVNPVAAAMDDCTALLVLADVELVLGFTPSGLIADMVWSPP